MKLKEMQRPPPTPPQRHPFRQIKNATLRQNVPATEKTTLSWNSWPHNVQKGGGAGWWVGTEPQAGAGRRPGRPSLPSLEDEQPDWPVPRPSGLLTAASPHWSASEQETVPPCVYACAQGGVAHLCGAPGGQRGQARCICTRTHGHMHTRLAACACERRRNQMEQGPTEPHTGRSTFLLSSGGAEGGYY